MLKIVYASLLLTLLSACATHFPRPENVNQLTQNQGKTLFEETFLAHGGQYIDALKDVNLSIDGKWKHLIRRIQPLVTDFTYRVQSEERLLPNTRVYAAHYKGPAGTKSVFRSPNEIRVSYNRTPSNDLNVLSSTALTGDAFHLFLLGPLALKNWRDDFIKLPDAKLNKQLMHRIYLSRKPGFGYSNLDEVVLWINPENKLTTMIQITLEGHVSTQGAHVEVEYLDYVRRGKYTFPIRFFERVNAPISIDAHAWYLTGFDINRGYQVSDINQDIFSGKAAAPAEELFKNNTNRH